MLAAAIVRHHETILKLANTLESEQDMPEQYYHKQCRSVFTMKRDLESLKRKEDKDITGASTSQVTRQKDLSLKVEFT